MVEKNEVGNEEDQKVRWWSCHPTVGKTMDYEAARADPIAEDDLGQMVFCVSESGSKVDKVSTLHIANQ